VRLESFLEAEGKEEEERGGFQGSEGREIGQVTFFR
jgi:hypothetical protein